MELGAKRLASLSPPHHNRRSIFLIPAGMRTENPRVGGSIPPLTLFILYKEAPSRDSLCDRIKSRLAATRDFEVVQHAIRNCSGDRKSSRTSCRSCCRCRFQAVLLLTP